ncbi:MAG: winged helix-turn-helix transcriptional regulator [Halobacteriota archaeon]
MSETRTRIRSHVESTPGVHFNELVRDLDIATGQAQYHLRRLVRNGAVTRRSILGKTHYYPPRYDPFDEKALALLRRETARDILTVALGDEPVRAPTIASEIDIARSTVSWHLENLESAGIVETTYTTNGTVVVEVVRPDRVRTLLKAVSPSMYDRLVDRFGRLVDEALEPPE